MGSCMKSREMFRRRPERFGAVGGGRMELIEIRGVEAGGEGTECNKGEDRTGWEIAPGDKGRGRKRWSGTLWSRYFTSSLSLDTVSAGGDR